MRLTEKEFAQLTGSRLQKPNKHRNVKVYVIKNGLSFTDKETAMANGQIEMVFDSKKEYARWEELKLLARAGKISNLLRQVRWEISPQSFYQGEKIREIVYTADFQYEEDGKLTVEDVKPFDTKTGKYRTTKDFAIKWKLLKQKYPNINFVLY